MTIVALPTPTAKRSESTVKLLRETLERAEAGEVTQIMMIAFSADDRSSVCFSPLMDSLRKIGAVRQIEWDIMQSRDDS